jgi:hypothetical protein
MKNFNKLREVISEDYFTVQYYNSNGSLVDDKFKNFKSKASADKYAKKGNSIDKVGGSYKTFKVKGRMESVEVKGDMESIELDEALNIKSVMSELKKKLSLLSGDVKSGNTNDIITRLESISISIDKSVKELKRNMKESVELDEYGLAKGRGFPGIKADNTVNKSTGKKKKKKNKRVLGQNKNIAYNYDKDKRKESVDVDNSEDTLEENMKGIAKALTSMAGKPEYKKVAKNLKSLAMRAGEGDKKAAKQISTQLDKLIMKVDKKSAKKLMKLADLSATYESVEEGWKKKKKNEECGLDHDTLKKKKMKKHMDDVHEDELEEGVSLSKKGNYEVTVDGKSSVGIRIGLRFKGKLIVPGTKQKGLFVMGFNKKDGKHKLPPGATIVKDSGKYVHIGFKKVDDIIAYAVLENITEELVFQTFAELREHTK